jgi:hypothetical protein
MRSFSRSCELSRVGNLSMAANVEFFEKAAAQSENEAEADVYRKFALALGRFVEASPVELQRSFRLIQGGLG